VEDVTGGSLEALLETDPAAAERPLCVLADWLAAMAAVQSPSTGKVHGELGPDHVLLDHRGDPVLIDIEGTKYFDVEVEHVWVRMRFGEHYAKLRRGDLDEDRLRLYQLCMHLDLVAGPLLIAGTNHPEREWFRSVAEHHLQRALQFTA
jgi:aminoglycoside phosphotransferase (APT) family kinase protein